MFLCYNSRKNYKIAGFAESLLSLVESLQNLLYCKDYFMLFSSLEFIFIFLPVVFVLFFVLKNTQMKGNSALAKYYNLHHFTFAKIFLIAASLFFYAFYKLSYLPILCASILINFLLAKGILRANANNVNGGGL